MSDCAADLSVGYLAHALMEVFGCRCEPTRSQRHVVHARTCDCLGHAATCCDPTCCQLGPAGASDDE